MNIVGEYDNAYFTTGVLNSIDVSARASHSLAIKFEKVGNFASRGNGIFQKWIHSRKESLDAKKSPFDLCRFYRV